MKLSIKELRVLLRENLNDREFYKVATLIYDELIEHIASTDKPSTLFLIEDSLTLAALRKSFKLGESMRLKFLFTRNRSDKVRGQFNAKARLKTIWVTLPADLLNTKYIDNELLDALKEPDCRSVVIHEIVHLMDNMRLKASTWTKNLNRLRSTLSDDNIDVVTKMTKYVNDPIEWNAHFYQLTDLIKTYVQNYSHVDQRFSGDSVDQFINNVERKFKNFPLIRYAEGTLKRKLEKRLAQFWVEEFKTISV